MEPELKSNCYHPQHYFHYPFTIISPPKKTFTSKTIEQPTAYEVYCPISCKKIKIGAIKAKQKEGLEFNTTSNRWVSTMIHKNIRYLINRHPPNKKDKRQTDGVGWGFWIEVSEKGNFAVFNPYCSIHNDPLSLYSFAPIAKYEVTPELGQFQPRHQDKDCTTILVASSTLFLKQSPEGSFLSTNTHFDDSISGQLTFQSPTTPGNTLKLATAEALKLIPAFKNYWLHQLHIHIIAERQTESSEPAFNLDEVYQNLSIALHLEEQLRAKLSNEAGVSLLHQKLGYHPRLYSAINRLTSFINYGITKYNTKVLAEVGFYNKSDSLQDLVFFEYPQIPIPVAEDPSYQSQLDLRQKLFPFSRIERKLPNVNITLDTYIKALLHQPISQSKIKYFQVCGPYILFVDEKGTVSVWSCRLFPIRLFYFWAGTQQVQIPKTSLQIDEKEANLVHIEKEENTLASLFDEVQPAAKEVKPVAEPVPDQSMVEQMVNMGYGINIVKKALLAVKNQSVPAAIDMIEQIMTEEKKKKAEAKSGPWSCPACTYFNKAEIDTCQICGYLNEFVDEAEKERQRLEEEAAKEQERKKEEEKLKAEREAEAEKQRLALQEAERHRKIEQKQEMLKKAELLCTRLLYRENSPIDPFFIIQIFWLQEKSKCNMKITRVGSNRQYFSKFYRIQQKNLVPYYKYFPFPIEHPSFQKIAALSVDQRQWGIRLIEPSDNKQWGVIDIKQVELPTKYSSIQVNGDCLTLSEGQQQIHFVLQIKDTIESSAFQIAACQQPGIPIKQEIKVDYQPEKVAVADREIEEGKEIAIYSPVSEIQVEIIEHLPGGVWKKHEPQSSRTEINTSPEGQVIMNELLPLAIEHFQGSVFSSKHYSSTMLQKSPQLYISNYPRTNFTFRHLSGKSIYAENIIIVSSTKRLQRIFSVCQGLIFTADQPTWFHLAKERFQTFTKADYQNWLTTKKARTDHRQFWQPVGFFNLDGQTQIQLDYKRTAKYIFLLPTNVKGQAKKDQVYAIKIDFFGVKGRVEEERANEGTIFKNQGKSGCSVQLFKDGVPFEDGAIVPKHWGHVNSYYLHPPSDNFINQAPLSTTTVFFFKLRSNVAPTTLKVNSKYAKKIFLKLNKEAAAEQVDSSSIKNYQQLIKIQNQFTVPQLKKIAESLSTDELISLLLKEGKKARYFESLISKLDDSLQFRERLLQSILQMVPRLIDDQVEASDIGFKSFMALYQKQITGQPNLAFTANNEALKRITRYVNENRNKNYNLLRLKYNIEELVLEPYYFSKDYYRMVHPNYIEEEPKAPSATEPTGPLNCFLFSHQHSPYFYSQWIDLQSQKHIDNIKFFVPKISLTAFRPKLQLSVWKVDDNGEKLIYHKYFHEDLLVQLGVYGFKDSQIYRGQRLNYWAIYDVDTKARFLRVEYSFLVGTTLPHTKYKDTVDKFILIPLVQGKETGSERTATKVIDNLKAFPQQPKHFYNLEKLPPCRFSTEGDRSIFAVHEFPIVQLSAVKQEYKDLVEKITSNIMDETIVRDAIKGMNIANYEFNHKGIDFAYTYILHLMSLSRKFPTQLHISVQLMLEMFDVLVVYQAGPIMRKTFAFLQDNYKRLNNPGKVAFYHALIDKYLSNLENISTLRITERYSPLKILEKLQNFDLLLANLFQRLQKSSQKSLKVLLVKLISFTLTNSGLGNLQLYSVQTGKYIKNMTISNLVLIAFKNCLWILGNVSALKEQALQEALDLLLMFISKDGPEILGESREQAVKAFMENVQVEEVWRLVFLTLKLKSETLKEKINKLFTVVTSNLTEKFKRSINDMLQQIIVRQEDSLYVAINPGLTEELWMNHLQTTLELVTMTRDSIFLDLDIALKLLQLPLTPRLWSLALNIIPRRDEVLVAIIKNFPAQYYNSLGKQITHFCEPLAGIRSIDSIHINWLDLVRQIRLEGKNLFALFVDQLEKSSFGGREGLTMATTADLKNLDVACELAKLVVQGPPKKQDFKESALRKLILWYFLNKSKEKGASPCTDKILSLSQTVRKLLTQLAEFEDITKIILRLLLEIRREGEVVERNFAQKRVPVHAALGLNRRFSECFEELLGQFMTNDELCSLFAFELKGMEYLLRTMDIQTREKEQIIARFPPDEQLLVSEKLMAAKTSGEKVQSGEPKEPEELKEEEFANSVKLMPGKNLPNMNPSNPDWTIYKKGNKNKIIFLSMTDPATYHEHPLYIQLAKAAQIRSIKVGFTAASYQFNDKLVATPSSVIIEGSLDGVSFEPIGEMDYLQDDAYIQGGVQVWVINCQRLRGCKSVLDTIQGLNSHRAKFLKIIVKRPNITFIEGQYSQLNGRNYNNLGCSLTFLSVTGDDIEKMPWWLVEGCRQISKRSSLRVLSSLLSESNSRTLRKIANDEKFSSLIRANFHRIRQYMGKYPEVMPQVVHMVGAGNKELGDWIVVQFLKEGGAEVQASIVSQIIISTPDRAFSRLGLFLDSILNKLLAISAETQIEAGLLYAKEIHFIESFCKTLQESYELELASGVFNLEMRHIIAIVEIYDRKHASPEIKSAIKLLVSLLHIKAPFTLSQPLTVPAMDLIWKNCTDHKTHFYHLLSALLVDRRAADWLRSDSYKKVEQIIEQTYNSCTSSDVKNLRLQLSLLSQISHHEPAFLRSKQVHIQLYNRIKTISHQEPEIIDSALKLMKKVVLGVEAQEQKIARLLFEDVGLLVKRRDPFLQRLFVGLLGLQQEVMISLRGLELQSSTKKEVTFSSKWLSKKQNKQLQDKISKKYKYSLLGEINGQIKVDHQELFLKAFSCNAFMMIMRFKLGEQLHTCGLYSPNPGKRNQDGDYFWEEIVNYEKSAFLFFLEDPEPLFVTNQSEGSMLGNIYGGDEEQQNAAIFYDEGQEIFRFAFNTQSPTVPKISLTKYKKELHSSLTSESLENNFQYQFIGLQFWDLKVSNTVALADSKITNLLSKSNYAKPPFSYYRHSPIYIFPANISISKFMTILGVKGTCETYNKRLSDNLLLYELETQSSDFVIDLDIQTNQQIAEKEVNEIGYIPVMQIFNHFSSLNGVVEVLRLGSESLKDWKKADRKKNFQHYMDELRSFISLPSFFNLFIKNQQYVTLLFEVASGLPDDESSTRNWEEEYVNNFRYIYKIVSDIFKFDRSLALRNMDRYSDFVEVILEKLSQITKQNSRTVKEQEENESEVVSTPTTLAKVKSEDRKKKKKGTGYGADNQNNSKWSASEWLQTRKNISQETLRVISIIASFLDCEVPLKDATLSNIIKQSCLLPLLESSLRSGSLLDISKQSQLFKAYLQIVKLLSTHPATIDCVLDLDKKYKPEQSQSIYSLLGKLNGNATIFSECLKSGKEEQGNQIAENVSIDIQKTYQIVDKAVRNLKKRGKGFTIKEIDSMSVPEAYRILLSGLRFGYVNFKEGNIYKHAHSGSISNSTPPTSKILRLSQELADLSTSLPCENTNAIFVRCDQSRIDVIQILIMGSKDTPYSNGAFTFDVYCDDSYPNNPPKMLITTTGQGKIRFNPNLYSCGKVCLSLLGTWRGSASENWDPKVSTLLQLFISTQGITMSDDVYFNEPGFEGEQGTEQGDRKNEAYSNIVRLGNVRYAMVGQLKNPAKGFEQVIRRHFYIKKKEILEECQKWVQYADKREASYNGLVNDHNSTWCAELKQSKTKYKELLVKEIEELKELLNKLPPPNLKEKDEEPTFVAEKQKEKGEVKAVNAKLEEVDVGYENQSREIKEYGENVLQDRWSRYIGAMGIQAVKKQAESSVLLVGLKPLGLEIAKNLVLSGLKKLTILQNSKIENNSEHFYMSNVNSGLLKDCIFKIKELNPYMTIQHTETLPVDLAKYTAIVSTENYEYSRQLSQNARKLGVKFIYAETKGVSGIYFADLGNHEVNDDNGEEPFQGIIKHISNEEDGLVTLLDGVKHPYQDGDYVVINLVEGMETVQEIIEEKSEAQLFFEKQSQQKPSGINNRVFKIKVINWNSFRIGDTRNFTPYKANGLCRNLKVPKKHQFESFEVCSQKFEEHTDPNMGIYDFEKMGDNTNIFFCFKALGEYEKINKNLPNNWSIKESKAFVDLVEQSIKGLNKSQEQVQNALKFANNFSLICEAEMPIIGAYLGGLVSQQVIKAITNKYMPIKQFFTFHFNEMAQKVPETAEELEKLQVKKQEQFRNLKIVLGQQGAKKIEELKTFVIGAGAIGCELLKNFAMINMGAKGEIVVTDPDHIETSNLSRQFLFRDKHVKKAKSATACATLLQLNPRLEGHVHARLDKVCEETEEIYSNQFFKSRQIVANALDNVRARQYMDKRCVENKVPLFESGTLGPKGHVQVIVPYKTENYGSQNDPNEENQIPHCTLKMFPEETVHCIEWARDIFGKMFTLNPKALKKVIESKDLKSLEGAERETVAKMIKYRPESFDDCIAEAVRKFYIYYRNNVRQLLFTYPLDMKTKEGKAFWTLPKRPPKQINQLDSQDEIHRTFITSYAVLLAKTYSLPYPKEFRKKEEKDNIMKVAVKVKVEDFVPNAEASKEIEKEVEKESGANSQQKMQQPQIVELEKPASEQVELTEEVLQIKPSPEEFQKDEDSNGHIDLIYSMSNLRCRNYGLNQCTWIESKLKAGKILAALSTTTSVVAALQTIEIMKLATGGSTWRNGFINIAVPLIQITEPGPPIKHSIGNTSFTVWDEWHIKASTLKEVLAELKEKYEVQGYNISMKSGQPVYWQAMYADKEQAREQLLSTKLKTMFEGKEIELSIALRRIGTGQNYQQVPKIKIEINE